MSKLTEPPVVTDATADACRTPLAEQVLPADKARDLAPAFKALGDPVRLQLLSQIATAADGEVCVCDLTPAFDLTGPTISHHLKVLREAGLIDSERRGTWIYYRAVPARMAALAHVISPMDEAAGP